MQVVIERKDSFDGYVVTCEDGRVFEAETITKAIELKEELQNESLYEAVELAKKMKLELEK